MAVDLALKIGGEIISADSRQVYKGMNLGSGKITKKEMRGIPHHLLDVASPKKRFSVAQYQKLARKALKEILARNKTPIVVGGTGFYIQALIDGIVLPEVKPDQKLRAKLEKLSLEKLFERLKKLDPKRAKNIDKNNKRRLIRALEIVLKTGKPVPPLKEKPLSCPILILGVKKNKEELSQAIYKRILERLKKRMIAEVRKIRKSGVSWEKLESFGLEYRWIARYLQQEISKEEMILNIQKDSEKFAKRQMTWFKRDKRVNWVKNYKEAKGLVECFLGRLPR